MSNEREIKGSWLDSYVKYTKNQDSPELFHRWVGLTVISAAVRRHVWMLRPGYKQLHPNVYTILIAPSGIAKKSTACDMGVDILREANIGVKVLNDKVTPEGLVSFLQDTEVLVKKNVKQKEGDYQDIFKKILSGLENKESVEKMVDVIKPKKPESQEISVQCNAFIYTPELSTFLGSKTYTDDMLDILTRLFDSPRYWSSITKSEKLRVELTNVHISWLGASTPEWLAKGLTTDSSMGGFVGRVFFVYQDKTDRRVLWPGDEAVINVKLKGKLLHDLKMIAELEGEVKVDDDAKDLITEWCNKRERMLTEGSGYTSRWQEHLLKIAMLLSVAKNNELIIGVEEAMEAHKMLTAIEPQIKHALAYVGATNEARLGNKVVDLIGLAGGKIDHKSLMLSLRTNLRSSRELADIVAMLREEGRVIIDNTSSNYVYHEATYNGHKTQAPPKQQKQIEPEPLSSLSELIQTSVKVMNVSSGASTQQVIEEEQEEKEDLNNLLSRTMTGIKDKYEKDK